MDPIQPFRVIPVLDVKQGVAVHGRAGRRDQYQPVQSVLAPSSDPLTLARGIRDRLEIDELYLADLDAIAGGEPHWDLLRALGRESIRLFVDAGVSDRTRSRQLLDLLADDTVLVLGMETIPSLTILRSILADVPANQRMVSLDMDNGVVRTLLPEWRQRTPLEVAETLFALGVDQLLLLDIARVGMEQGMGTSDLATDVRRAASLRASDLQPLRELWCGGGIRTHQDLVEARVRGCSGVLVATALHSGRITRDDLQVFRS